MNMNVWNNYVSLARAQRAHLLTYFFSPCAPALIHYEVLALMSRVV